MQVVLNHPDVEASNRFLRAYWAELRATFGKCAWQYSPSRNGEAKTIHFGWMDLGSPLVGLEVHISYARKGVIHTLFVDGGELAASDVEKLTKAVERASARMDHPTSSTLAVRVTSPVGVVGSYNGNCFQIAPCGLNTNEIKVSVLGYDSIDAHSEAQGILLRTLDVLSVFTNATFDFVSNGPPPRRSLLGSVKRMMRTMIDRFGSKKAEWQRKTAGEENSTFHTEYDWIDGHPLSEKKLLLWREEVAFLDELVSGKIPRDHPFVNASVHFHTATKVWMDAQSMAFTQVAEVLLVSALEAATNLAPIENITCQTCGQKVYSIRRRVNDLAKQYTNELICDFIDDYYHRRSRYLHVGTLWADGSYAGTSIPLLDPSSPNGCRQQIAHPPFNLTEYVGFTLRQVFLSQMARKKD
jgi:hypothetical protein